MDHVVIHGKKFVKYISAESIDDRVKQMAQEIKTTIDLNEYIMVILLNGAFVFASDLFRKFNQDVETKFIKISSYHDFESSGKIEFNKNALTEIEGKKILIIEDIIDTGNTLHEFIQYLFESKVVDVKICSLLLKPGKLNHAIQPDYLGFSISDLFVVGYGLDFNERGRGLKDIYTLSDE